MKSFKVQLANGYVIDNRTKITINGIATQITTEKQLCQLIKKDWCKLTDSKSFTDWANKLNDSGEYDGTFTKYDALDNLSSSYVININGCHVHAYEFFNQHLPFN